MPIKQDKIFELWTWIEVQPTNYHNYLFGKSWEESGFTFLFGHAKLMPISELCNLLLTRRFVLKHGYSVVSHVPRLISRHGIVWYAVFRQDESWTREKLGSAEFRAAGS